MKQYLLVADVERFIRGSHLVLEEYFVARRRLKLASGVGAFQI
jgi:hypothetical protein